MECIIGEKQVFFFVHTQERSGAVNKYKNIDVPVTEQIWSNTG
jgi:hypothetical protein